MNLLYPFCCFSQKFNKKNGNEGGVENVFAVFRNSTIFICIFIDWFVALFPERESNSVQCPILFSLSIIFCVFMLFCFVFGLRAGTIDFDNILRYINELVN